MLNYDGMSNSEFVYNVVHQYSNLPLINATFKYVEAPCLLDCGSTISICDNNFLKKIKNSVTYKHLASSISIQTLNSTFSFNACILLSFKIQGMFCKHPMYIVDILPV